jgi:hypothetical protein
MTISAHTEDRILMSQKERDVHKIMHGVLRGERSQAQASHLLGLTILSAIERGDAQTVCQRLTPVYDAAVARKRVCHGRMEAMAAARRAASASRASSRARLSVASWTSA